MYNLFSIRFNIVVVAVEKYIGFEQKKNSIYLGNIYNITLFFISKLIANTILPNHWLSVRKIIESNKSPLRYINPDIYSIPVKKKMMFPYDNISGNFNHNILHIFILTLTRRRFPSFNIRSGDGEPPYDDC